MDSVESLLDGLGLREYLGNFRDAEICKEDLHDLTDLFLRKSLRITNPAHREKILVAIGATDVHFSLSGTPEYRRTCVALAESPLWLEAVVDYWPGPIAHEYQRLRELLLDGEIVSAVWQLKDVGEVLIRFPACVMARDVIENGIDLRFKSEIRTQMLGPPLSMGGWLTLAEKLSSHIRTKSEAGFNCPQIAGLFRSERNKETGLAKFLKDLTGWRNKSFGHGAFRLDLQEFASELQQQLETLHKNLATLCELAIWDSCQLVANDQVSFVGAYSIRRQHDEIVGTHNDQRDGLLLRTELGDLQLAPYVQIKHCTICDHQDVFLFDWRKINSDKKGRDRYGFIDYMTGHGIESKWYEEKNLHAEVKQLDALAEANVATEDSLDEDMLDGEIVDLLAKRAVTERYKTPKYLREALRGFLENNDKGILWVKAPGHIGKSTFVSGLDTRFRHQFKEKSLSEDLRVAVFYVRREYQTWPAQLSEILGEQIKEGLNLRAGTRELPRLDLEAENPAKAFCSWLAKWRAAVGYRFRILVCIDGLDELRESSTGERSIADFIPTADQIPEGIYVLVTSRPEAELPRWLCFHLADRLRDSVVREVGLADPGYCQLLRDYFDERLGNRKVALEGMDKKGSPLDLSSLFNHAMDKSGGRFLYLSYIADLLADETLPLDGVMHLPAEEKLFYHFLTEIKRTHQGSKLEDYFERVLIQLAAAEQLYEIDRETQPAVARKEAWKGVPREALCKRMEGRPDGKPTVRLAYVLYTLKAVLGTWRAGNQGGASYRLGLNGLSPLIARCFGPQLSATHRALLDNLYAQFEEGDAEGFSEPVILDLDHCLRLRYMISHMACAGETDWQRLLPIATKLLQSMLDNGSENLAHNNSISAISWLSTAASFGKMVSDISGSKLGQKFGNIRANSHIHLGAALADQGDLTSALENFGLAITITEALQRDIASDLPTDWAINLVTANLNKGVCLSQSGEQNGAIAAFSRAIELGEELRQRLSPRWTSDFSLPLVKSYVNRGGAMLRKGNIPSAVNDTEKGIELLRLIAKSSDGKWNAAFTDTLISAYINRGSAKMRCGDIDGAAEQFSLAIKNAEKLTITIDEKCNPDFILNLATAHINRGATALEERDALGAGHHFEKGIDLLKAIYERLGPQCPPVFIQYLSASYANRAASLSQSGDIEHAAKDYEQAIKLGETLRERLGSQLTPEYARAFATAYSEFGHILFDANRLSEAGICYGNAIQLIEISGGAQNPNDTNTLASLYAKCGAISMAARDYRSAATKYEHVIELRGSISHRIDTHNSPKYENTHVITHLNLGYALAQLGDVSGAETQYGLAIKRGEALCQHFASQSPPSYANTLARAYANRRDLRLSVGDRNGADEDNRRVFQWGVSVN